MTDKSIERQKFHKERFEIISEEKQNQILKAAIEEFSVNGFNGTSINKVAKRAEISIGAMYSYFESKDDLFLSVVERLFGVLEGVLHEVDLDGDILDIIEALFYRAHDYAMTYPEMNQIYLDFSTHSLSNLSSKVSRRLETITKNLYMEVIHKAQSNRKADPTINASVLSFMIDNLIMMYQFSFTSDYFKERMQIFLGDSDVATDKACIQEIMKIIRKMIQLEQQMSE